MSIKFAHQFCALNLGGTIVCLSSAKLLDIFFFLQQIFIFTANVKKPNKIFVLKLKKIDGRRCQNGKGKVLLLLRDQGVNRKQSLWSEFSDQCDLCSSMMNQMLVHHLSPFIILIGKKVKSQTPLHTPRRAVATLML